MKCVKIQQFLFACFYAALSRYTVLLCCIALIHALSVSADPDDLYTLAKRAFSDGFYDVSARQYEAYLQQEPDSKRRIKVVLRLGRCYYELQRWSNSFSRFQQIRPKNSTVRQYAESLYWTGRIHEHLGNIPRALFQYETASSLVPGNSFVYMSSLRAGQLYLQRGESARCRAIVTNSFIPEPPNNSPGEYYFLLGQCDLADRQPTTALQTFSTALSAETNKAVIPYLVCGRAMAEWAAGATNRALVQFSALKKEKNPPAVQAIAHYFSAVYYLSRAETGMAYKTLEILIKIKPKTDTGSQYIFYGTKGFPTADALLLLGRLAATQGDHSSARDWYSIGRNEISDPDSVSRAEFGLGQAQLLLGNTASATQIFQRLTSSAVLEIKTGSILQLADISSQGSNYIAAIDLYRQATALSSNLPVNTAVRLNLAITHYRHGDYDTATAQFDKLAATPGDPSVQQDAAVWRAWCCLKLNRTADAEEALKTYLWLYPDGAQRDEVRLQLAQLAYRQNDYAEAERLYTDLITNWSDRFFSEQASYELGWIYVNQGKKDDAVLQFSRFAAQYPSSELYDDIQYYLGETYFNMKEYDRARAALLRIIKEIPTSKHAGPSAYWAALAAYRMGDLNGCTEIISDYWPAIQGCRYMTAAMLLKGDCYAAQNLCTQAVNQFEATWAAATDSYIAVEAQFRIADTCLALSNTVRAINLYSNLTKDMFGANRARAHLSLGKAQAMAGYQREALSEWLKVIYDYPSQTRTFKDAVAFAAAMYEKLNEPDRAEQIYRISLEATSRNGKDTSTPGADTQNPL